MDETQTIKLILAKPVSNPDGSPGRFTEEETAHHYASMQKHKAIIVTFSNDTTITLPIVFNTTTAAEACAYVEVTSHQLALLESSTFPVTSIDGTCCVDTTKPATAGAEPCQP